MRKTIVVNRHYKSYDVYIGRGTKFGNKYQIGPDGTREDVIAKHKKDFYDNPELQEAVWDELRGEIIGCSCKPLACHGDTYVEYIENRETKDLIIGGDIDSALPLSDNNIGIGHSAGRATGYIGEQRKD